MLYYLSLLRDLYSGFNIFSYITLRSGAAAVTSFLLCLGLAPRLMQWLEAVGMVHKPKVFGPASHHAKAGVPVGGGLFIVLSLLASMILWARLDNRFVIIAFGLLALFATLGFWDDWIKIKGRRQDGRAEGVSSRIKFFLQVAAAAALAFYLTLDPPHPDYLFRVNVPYMKESYWNLGGLYFFLLMMLFVGFTNSVNLTDGLDGLAAGNLVIAAAAMLVFVYLAGHAKFSQYLKIIYVRDAGELSVVLAALVGAGLGFLWYNAYPAQVFMGDTGSLPLGALLVYVALVAKQELLFPIIGGVFLAEAASVMFQISYFKFTKGKRIFRMSPLHHHFELCGIAEPKVVVRFWIAGIVLAVMAFASLKVR